MRPRDVIALGRKVEAFLNDPDVEGLFERLDRDAFERFRGAKTGRERLQAWAFSQALEDLKAALKGAVEDGHLASETR